MSVIERCHFVAYSFVFPALPSLSAVPCIVTARPPHSSTPTLQNTNNQEDPSIHRSPSSPPAPRLSLVDPSVFRDTFSLLSLAPLHRRRTKQPVSHPEPPARRSLFIIRHHSRQRLRRLRRHNRVQRYCPQERKREGEGGDALKNSARYVQTGKRGDLLKLRREMIGYLSTRYSIPPTFQFLDSFGLSQIFPRARSCVRQRGWGGAGEERESKTRANPEADRTATFRSRWCAEPHSKALVNYITRNTRTE
jgi:hypothetical protein